jgi:type IV fimbrial biogenesis protein FimT
MKTQSGFTFIELMTTLSVGIIILAIGVPAFVAMMSTNQAAGYANDLVGAIRLARSEAVKRSASVTICASNTDQTACSGNNWNNGWIVFSDDNNDSALDAEETVHRVWAINTDERDNLVFHASSPSAIRFNASGGNAAGTQMQVAFQKNDCDANQSRQITVSVLGRPSLDLVACF